MLNKISTGEINALRQKGAVTFRPVSGGRLRCNQLPGLPPLTKKQAANLRTNVFGRSGAKAPKGPDYSRRTPQHMTAPIDGASQMRCPHCRHFQPIHNGKNDCVNCSGLFYVEPPQLKLSSYRYW